MKKRKKGFLAGGIALLMVCCMGCGTQEEQVIPELLEPIAVNSAYRPVEKGKIGNVSIRTGTVAPKEYPHFFRTQVKIREILVEVGDYVKEGDVLAYVDLSDARSRKKELEESLVLENTLYEISRKIAEQESKRLSSVRAASEAIGDSEGADNAQKTLAVNEENARYDRQLHEYRVKNLTEEIAAQQKVIDDGTLTAVHSGYVTNLKSLASMQEATGSESVVTVSDYDELYIALNISYEEYDTYKSCEKKYIKGKGAEYPVKEVEYSSDEMIFARARGLYPQVLLECPKELAASVGENVPVYYLRKDSGESLLVGKDSLYNEGDRRFVYVLGENGQKERREVTIGDMDANYAEVLEGLEEGEMVYYQSTAKMPENYSEYTISLTDFAIPNFTNRYKRGNSTVYIYTSEYEGTIDQFAVKASRDVEIEKGDLLYVIDTGEGKAAITEAKMNLEREQESYRQALKSMEEQKVSLEEQIAGLREQMNSQEALENPYLKTILECDLQIAICQKERTEIENQLTKVSYENSLKSLQETYDDLRKNNDGTGKVSVYAEHSGKVTLAMVSEGQWGKSTSLKAGDKVAPGDEMLYITAVSGDQIMVDMSKMDGNYPNVPADCGETVTFVTEEGDYTGTCVSTPTYYVVYDSVTNDYAAKFKVWLGTDADGVYLSVAGDVGYSYTSFYVQMEDTSFSDEETEARIEFSHMNLSDVVVLPSKLVKEESSPTGRESGHYVWRLRDGQLIKQYVVVSEEYSSKTKSVILSGLSEGDVIAAE